MAVELIPQLPAQDSAVLSRGIAPRKSRGDSLKTDAISGVITAVLLRSIPCEGFVSARFTLRKRQQESQDLGNLPVGGAGSHKVMCLRKIENAHGMLFRNQWSGDVED